MTTKYRIIIGFSIMVLLMGGVSAIGYINLQKSSEAFVNFQRQAQMNVASSDLVGVLNEALLKTSGFMRDRDSSSIAQALAAVDKFSQIAKTAEESAALANHKANFQNLRGRMSDLKKTIEAVRDNQNALVKQYVEIIRPNCLTIADALVRVGDAAMQMQNFEATRSLLSLMNDFALALPGLGRFSESATQKDAVIAQERFLALGAPLKDLEDHLHNENTRRIYRELFAAYENTLKALENMVKNSAAMSTSVDALLRFEKDISETIHNFSAKVDDEMRAEARQLLDNADAARATMLLISIAGIFIGLALAAYTIICIIRVLRDMSDFAQAIAAGNFEHHVRSREKGEIGAMVAAMQQIPATLKAVLDEYHKLEEGIEHGQLSIQGNAANFRGGFATIIQGTNSILQRFLTVIENIPTPVAMLNRQRLAAYINASGRKWVGENYEGKRGAVLFAREDTSSGNDAASTAVANKCAASGECVIRPQGKEMYVNYTVIPMLNAKGDINSIMQLYTDLTSIKNQQRAILDAAHQASEISNRVAAASEQLSAQVEQVSRGAEMQRTRVESTASAMTEMNSTVLEVARNAGEASEQSEKTRSKANDGASLVNQVVRSINQVNTVAMTLQNNMKELGVQAESIGGVMNVISDIADQTNLLALNAAIEAARAGEAGRGFAVVADEVRKLAEKTMQATHEVGSSITAIQQSAHTNIEEVGNAVKNIHDATELANSSGTALSEIVDLASSNSAVVASIATAAEEQSATSEEINRAIEEINHIVGETTDGMVQSSAAVQELSHMAQELRRVMENLR